MLYHNLLLVYRSFKRFRNTFFINLVGLSSGLACTILIYLWISDEISFDKFHEKNQRLFQVMENEQTSIGIKTSTGTPGFLAKALQNEIPEIEMAEVATPSNFFPSFTLSDGKQHVKGNGKFAGRNFFTIFSYNLFHGNNEQVLNTKNAIVLSERLARSLFGSTDVVGKTAVWEMMDIKQDVIVTGVYKNVPSNSSEQFDFVLSFESFKDIMKMNDDANWNQPGPFDTYVLLNDPVNEKQLNTKLADLISIKTSATQQRSFFARPYSDKYLYSDFENGVQSGGRIEYVLLFSTLAILILVIACINFMNLFTAKILRRVKEVGIKKVIGAKRRTLVAQYLTESLVMAFISLFIAIIVVNLVLPPFNEISGKQLELHFTANVFASIGAITVLTGLIAGSYPAIYLSAFNVTAVLKGQITKSLRDTWVRRGLVVIQFSVTIILIVTVLVVHKQMEFVQTKSIGYNKENVVYFDSNGKTGKGAEAFLTALKKLPGVINASSMIGNIISGRDSGHGGMLQYNGKDIPVHDAAVNYDMLETLGIPVIEGKSFSRELGADTMKVILNKAAIHAMELKDPIGKKMPGSGAEIIGVVDNFHFQSLHEEVKPFIFRLEPHYAMTIMARIKNGSEKETLSDMKTLFTEFNPGFNFDYHFLDETYQAQYVAEKRVKMLSGYCAILAIIISCLGLLSLAHFSTERRIKEISIRKILGSSVADIVYLLSGDFTKTVLLSIVLALPVSYFITSKWLDGFAFRITLEWWYFVSAGVMAIVIMWITIGTQIFKTANANPVQSLRNE